MICPTISDDLKKRSGNLEFLNNEAAVKGLSGNLLASGLGQSMLKAGDRVVAVKGLTVVKSKIRGQQEPIEYLAVIVSTDKGIEKMAACSSLIRRKPGAEQNHGIFAEESFAKAVNYEDFYAALIVNPVFTVTAVLRNQEFPGFKASVYETTR